MSTKYRIIGIILLIAIAFAVGRYLTPTKIVTKTNTITVNHDIIHDHVTTVVVTKELPNGEKDTTTTTTDNTVVDDKTNANASTSTTISNVKPQWKVQALAGLNGNNITVPVYGADIERRIIGPISAGLYGNSNKEVGLSISLEL
jgi:hypothetical protein